MPFELRDAQSVQQAFQTLKVVCDVLRCASRLIGLMGMDGEERAMNLYINIGGSQKMTLTGAVLVYEGGDAAFAAWHPAMRAEEGPPFLGPAEPLTTDFLKGLASVLGAYVAPEVLPENVLVRTAELTVWWTAVQHRTLFFADHSEAVRDLNGRRYPIPPLVFKALGGSYRCGPWRRTSGPRRRPL